MRKLAFFLVAIVIGLSTHTAKAQNLNKEYGAYWDCGYITAGLPLYDYCKPCEDKGMDFFMDTETTGHCVPKEGGDDTMSTPVPAPSQKKTLPVKKKVQYTIRFCNDTRQDTLYVSLGTNDQLGGVMRFTVRGWYTVSLGECKNLSVKDFGNYAEMVFSYHAQAGTKYWPAKVWPGNKNWTNEEWQTNSPAGHVNFCVDPNNRFERYAVPTNTCPRSDVRAFGIIWVDKEEGVEMVVKEVRVQ